MAPKNRELLKNPPSDRIGFYTTGDCCMIAYDSTRDNELDDLQDKRNFDFCRACAELDAELGTVDSAMNIHSTAG